MKSQLVIFLFLLVNVAQAYDFSAACPTGQPLYYSITDAENFKVRVTFPGPTIDSAYYDIEQPEGSLYIPEQVAFNGNIYEVTSIGTCAFAKCSTLTGTLTIPPTITSIECYAFLHCGHISTLVFKASRCTRAFAAFEGCAFGSIIIEEGVEFIPDGIFANSTGISTISFPSTVQSIGTRACYNCPNLKKVFLPDRLNQIGDYAFCDCPSLEFVSTINSKSIGKSAFRNAVKLEVIHLGTFVHFVDEEAFYYCDNVDTVYCHALNPPSIDQNTFSDGILSGKLCVLCEVRDDYLASQGWNRFGETLTIDPYVLQAISHDEDCGYVSVTGSLYCFGDDAMMEAIPFENYRFDSWDDGNMENPRIVTMESDTTFVAHFSIDTTFVCVEGVDCHDGFVTTSGNRVCVHHAKGKSVGVYSIVGRLVFIGHCDDEKTCFILPKQGVYLVCIEGKPRCYKVIL